MKEEPTHIRRRGQQGQRQPWWMWMRHTMHCPPTLLSPGPQPSKKAAKPPSHLSEPQLQPEPQAAAGTEDTRR